MDLMLEIAEVPPAEAEAEGGEAAAASKAPAQGPWTKEDACACLKQGLDLAHSLVPAMPLFRIPKSVQKNLDPRAAAREAAAKEREALKATLAEQMKR